MPNPGVLGGHKRSIRETPHTLRTRRVIRWICGNVMMSYVEWHLTALKRDPYDTGYATEATTRAARKMNPSSSSLQMTSTHSSGGSR